MIPQISQAPGLVQLVLTFLQSLKEQGFTGDTATSYADRLTLSTDNSIYQLLPGDPEDLQDPSALDGYKNLWQEIENNF